MPRGRPFICWLDYNGIFHDVALYQGDPVMFRLKRRWWRGTIHCRRGKYQVDIGRRRFCVFFTFDLKAIVED